jgi:hypothetical protein
MRSITKAAALFLMMAPASMAYAGPAGCALAVQNARGLASNIAGGAGTYWDHHRKYVDYSYGKSHRVAGAKKLADDEKSNANLLKGAMPKTLASFQAAIQTARAQKCLPEADLRALEEKSIDMARNVNFNQFPVDETKAPPR